MFGFIGVYAYLDMCVYWGRFVHVYVYLSCVYTGVGMYVCKYTWHKYILRWVFMSVCILEYVLGWRWGPRKTKPSFSHRNKVVSKKHIATLSELGQLICLYCSKLK